MQASPQLSLNLIQLRSLSLPYGMPEHDELSIPVLPTDMREAKEIKSLWFPSAFTPSILGCKTTELDQTRLIIMKLKVELAKSFAKPFQEPLRL